MIPVDIHVALARPKYSSNIGATARACANLGAKSLSVIDSKADPFSKEARMGAAGANDHLDQIKIYNNKSQFVADHSNKIIIGLSRRGGKLRPSQDLKTTLKHLSVDHSEAIHSGGVQLLFGPEDHGLDSSEIEICHYICKLPKLSEFQSFNLAQAVLLTLYIAQDAINMFFTKEHTRAEPEQSQIQLSEVEETMKQWLLTLGMTLDSKRVNAFQTLKRMLKKSAPSQRELRLFEKVLQQTIRQLAKKE
ncbi:MAG: RNA methyltransferase [Bdellovibrionales bacterium]|nr:RNA methyltransferase [Bdellovibrionales bacterium]